MLFSMWQCFQFRPRKSDDLQSTFNCTFDLKTPLSKCYSRLTQERFPNRYMHTQVEMCDLRDVEEAVKLLTETIDSIKPGDTFIPVC